MMTRTAMVVATLQAQRTQQTLASLRAPALPSFDFIWLDPPYWRMKRYIEDPRCLSNSPTVEDFRDRLRQTIVNCVGVLRAQGKLAVLMGDNYHPQERRHLPLVHLTKTVCLEAGLCPAATDIIRFQHDNSASKRTNRTA